jgi:hypothetical protein
MRRVAPAGSEIYQKLRSSRNGKNAVSEAFVKRMGLWDDKIVVVAKTFEAFQLDKGDGVAGSGAFY